MTTPTKKRKPRTIAGRIELGVAALLVLGLATMLILTPTRDMSGVGAGRTTVLMQIAEFAMSTPGGVLVALIGTAMMLRAVWPAPTEQSTADDA
ncbi:MAG: hypothetical protein AAFR38_03375 [Planctomycetota bacterium]